MSAKHVQLHDVLSAFWDENVLDALPDDSESEGQEFPVDMSFSQLDSITVVDVLIGVEEIVGQKLPIEKIVRKGGYSSKEQFIEEITKAIDEYVESTA